MAHAPGTTGGAGASRTDGDDGLALGIDIGGTKVAVALVDAEGRVRRRVRIPTRPRLGVEATLDRAREAAAPLLDAGVVGVGVCVAGQVTRDGTLAGAPNLGWANVPLLELVRERFGAPVHVVNDVQAAGWAEWRFGAGRGSNDVLVLFVGTGVGGCVIASGRLLVGASGGGGELGHLTLVAGGHQCRCRHRGCIEAYVSGWAIERDAVAAAAAALAAGEREEGDTLCAAFARGGARAVTANVVARARAAGDPWAQAVMDAVREHFAAAAVGLVNAFNPERLVIGGGVVVGFPELVVAAEDAVRSYALPSAAAVCQVVAAALPSDAPVVGAADLARR